MYVYSDKWQPLRRVVTSLYGLIHDKSIWSFHVTAVNGSEKQFHKRMILVKSYTTYYNYAHKHCLHTQLCVVVNTNGNRSNFRALDKQSTSNKAHKSNAANTNKCYLYPLNYPLCMFVHACSQSLYKKNYTRKPYFFKSNCQLVRS